MAELTPSMVGEVVEACRAGVGEAGGALSRSLDCQLALAIGNPSKLASKPPEGANAPGLAVVLTIENHGAIFLIPESTGVLPPWCASPDATGQSKLDTLAQELGMLLLPEQCMPSDYKAGQVKNLAGAIARGGPADEANCLSLELSSGGQAKGSALLIWPISKPAAVLGAGAEAPKPVPAAQPAAAPKPKPPAAQKPAASPKPPASARPQPRRAAGAQELPTYAKSLLKIQVPVVVTLAQTKQSLGKIVELGPGSLIQFEKSCEEMLELDVGGRRVALGEAVKIGDKFGLRVTSIVLPEERFKPVGRKHQTPGNRDGRRV